MSDGSAPTGSRRQARERAVALLYEAEIKQQPATDVVAALPLPPDPYAREVVEGVDRHREEIDALLTRFSENWRLERMPALDRAVLRLATFELLHRPDVPTAAVLAEAVELASSYSTDQSGRFVNGVLAAVARQVRAN